MYLGKVILKNIRGFKSLEFDLERPDGTYAGWTVFTGDNGSGKSSLLKAIAVALTGQDSARALQPSFHRWIRDGATDEWLRSLQHQVLEGKSAEQKQLDLVLRLLRDDLMPNQISVDRVDSDGLWLRDRQGVALAWSEMSDGYRSAAALLADILRHLIATYGIDGLAEETNEGKTAVKRSGVVLIDEIDAHLHLEW